MDERYEYVRLEVQYQIPKILLDYLGNVDDSIRKHLAKFDGWEDARILKQVSRYVECRIRQEILAKYEKLEVQPDYLDGHWVELILAYRDAAEEANDVRAELETIRRMQFRATIFKGSC
jgi:hypothetical protein